jgi:hypothetical protein
VSLIYYGYFTIISGTVELESVMQINEKVGLKFAASGYSYFLSHNRSLLKTKAYTRSLEQFLADFRDPNGSPIAEWAGSGFFLHLGVFSDSGLRVVVLEISERSLERMQLALEDLGSGFLTYLVEVFKVLGANSLLMGPELEYSDAFRLLRGEHIGEAAVRICMGNYPRFICDKPGFKHLNLSGIKAAIDYIPELDS